MGNCTKPQYVSSDIVRTEYYSDGKCRDCAQHCRTKYIHKGWRRDAPICKQCVRRRKSKEF